MHGTPKNALKTHHVLKHLEVALHGGIAVPSRQDVRAGNRCLDVGILPGGPRHGPPPRQVALHLHLGLGHVAHVGQAPVDELEGILVQLLEVVARVGGPLGLPAHPLHVPSEGVDVLELLGGGVGVVVAEDGPTVLLGDAELLEGQGKVHVHRLGVADVEEAVGLGGEAGADDRTVDLGVLRLELGRIFGPCQFAGVEGVGNRGGLRSGGCGCGVVGHDDGKS